LVRWARSGTLSGYLTYQFFAPLVNT